MARALASIAVLTLAGCSCCFDNVEMREYPIDAHLASRVWVGDAAAAYSWSGCSEVCDVLAGRTDAGPTDAGLSDAGPPPMGRVSGCEGFPSYAPTRIRCYFGFPCGR